MNPIDDIPDLDWSDIAKAEGILKGKDLVTSSHLAIQVGQIAIAGLVYYNGFTSPPWFWFALAKGVTIRHLIDFRRLMRYIPPGSITAINPEEKDAIRFAKLYGFQDEGLEYESNGKMYKIFRRI